MTNIIEAIHLLDRVAPRRLDLKKQTLQCAMAQLYIFIDQRLTDNRIWHYSVATSAQSRTMRRRRHLHAA